MSPETVFLLLAAPCLGSFAGLVADRLPAGRPVLAGRSACEACGHVLGARDLVPFLSWLWSRGRCRHCGAWVGWMPLLFEIGALLAAIWSLALLPWPLPWLGIVLACVLMTLAVIDQRHRRLPDVLTLPLLALGLALAGLGLLGPLVDHALGAGLGWGLMEALAWLFWRLRGIEGLGRGDAKLTGAAGAWLGWQALPSVVLLAALAGLLLAGLDAWRRGRFDRRVALPFGPPLCLAFWLVWLYGPIG